jgi:hypothetical protein
VVAGELQRGGRMRSLVSPLPWRDPLDIDPRSRKVCDGARGVSDSQRTLKAKIDAKSNQIRIHVVLIFSLSRAAGVDIGGFAAG